MYKATQEIGGYKIGEEVPAEKAEIWKNMYKVSPVEEVAGEGELVKAVEEKEEAKKPEASEKEPAKNVMLDDYLGRNTHVVVKNIEDDALSKKQLEDLLKLEGSDKRRKPVLKAIEKKLRKLED